MVIVFPAGLVLFILLLVLLHFGRQQAGGVLTKQEDIKARAAISAARREGRLANDRSDDEVIYAMMQAKARFVRLDTRLTALWFFCVLVGGGLLVWTSFFLDEFSSDYMTFRPLGWLALLASVGVLVIKPRITRPAKRAMLEV